MAIFENEFYVATRNYLFQFDATPWGWIHLLVGLVVAFAGYGLLSGRTWARSVATILAVVSAIANFVFIPYGEASSVMGCTDRCLWRRWRWRGPDMGRLHGRG